MIYSKVFVLFGIFSLTKSQNGYMHNLPLGEYRTVFDKMYPCESTTNNSIKFNLYLSKKTSSITELKGNLTYLIPLGDTLTLDANTASWSLTGGWKPNSAVYITKNACSSAKKVLGNAFHSIVQSFNVHSTSCPIAVGTYITQGLDMKELEDHNTPKVYFYGKYKLTIKFKNERGIVVGCVVVELRLVRPWEKQI